MGVIKDVTDVLTSTHRPIKAKKSTQLCPRFSNHGTSQPHKHRSATPGRHAPDSILAIRVAGKLPPSTTDAFTGTCPYGDRCKYEHDFNKLAICKEYLRTGDCPDGDACDLSHDPTPHRVPACTHFLRGNCTHEQCRYAHVRVNQAAPVCRAFATLGYCDKGADCPERHVIECPDYANTGRCRNAAECRLPHVDRAGVLRKAAAQRAKRGSDEESDLSSDEGDYERIDSDDVDSDDLDDDKAVAMDDAGNESDDLTLQTDFVAFS